MNAIAVESVRSWHDRPIHMQSRENRNISVQSAIKPNLTADRQVWAQTGGQAQTRALGAYAILSEPHNPQKGLFRIFAILPQSRPRYLQSRRLRLDCGIETIQGNCFNSTKIAPCVLQDQSTDHDPSTIIAIMFWLQSDWQDCKVIHWVASELVGSQHTWTYQSKCNIRQLQNNNRHEQQWYWSKSNLLWDGSRRWQQNIDYLFYPQSTIPLQSFRNPWN